MASALQCPACGHKHRLTELSGDPVFACEQCGRLLKTPVEYRRPEPTASVASPRPNGSSQVQRGGSATRDQTSVLKVPKAAAARAAAAAPASRPATAPRPAKTPTARSQSRPQGALAVPLLALGWVVAVLLGGVIVRYFAKFTGLLTGDSLIDILTGSGIGRYFRLFALVPFWALATAGLMTLFVEGARRWEVARRTAPARAAKAPAGEKTSGLPKRVPPAKPRPSEASPTASGPPSEPASRPVAPSPAAAESRSPSGAASAPRVRRIPKHADISS